MMMNKKDIDEYRDIVQSRLEELTVINAEQNSNITNIKESVSEIKELVKDQNGRVRGNEKAISRIQGIGSVIALILGSLFGIEKFK